MIVDPVFVDRSGRRRRVVLVAGAAGAALLLAAVVMLLAGFTGAGPAGITGWPAAEAGKASPRHRAPALSSTTTTTRPAVGASARPTSRPVTPTPSPPGSATPSAAPSTAPGTSAPARGKGRIHSPSAKPSRKG